MNKKALDDREKWYYDACTLDQKNCYYDIVNKKPPKKAVISHLALGEAYGNCHVKKKNPIGAISALAGLIEKLRLGNYIKIVGNDNVDKELKFIKESSLRLSITDSVHLATAVKERCCVVVSTDSDFLRAPKKKLFKLKENFSLSKLVIIKMHDRGLKKR